MEEEIDLEQIDREMRMERIRQSSSKLTWDGFGQALRRNLMEKKLVFDADSRLDVIQAIRYLRKHVPVDANADLMEQLKQLSDSLECSFTHDNNLVVIKSTELHMEILIEDKTIIQCMVGFFGRPLVDSPEAKELLSRNDYESLRDSIDSILNVIPTSNNSSDRQTFISSLELVEGWLQQQNPQPVFDLLNTSPFGYFVKRDAVHPSRIYYFVDAHYENATSRKNFDYKLDHNLPYLELSIVPHDAELEQPMGSVHDPWSMKRRLHVCYCLRFSVPMMLSESIWYHLLKYLARHSVVRQHVNAFVYTSEFDFKDSELVLRTNFPSHVTQHRYTMSLDALKDEKDVVIGELYLDNIRNLDKVLALLRTQHVHNTLWESVLCVTRGTWNGGDTVKFKMWAVPGRFELQLYANERLHLVKIEQDKDSQKWDAILSTSDGRSVSADIDEQLTFILNRTHNIPCVMVRAISACGARPSPDPAAVCIDDSDVVSAFVDKVGDSWLPRLKRLVPDIEPAVVVQEEDGPGMGFLASFKEVDEGILVPIPTRPEGLPRTVRLNSEQSFNYVFSDLEAICQMADSWDGDGKTTTPVQSAKFDSSPAPRPGGPLPPGGITQLSPLESARLRMANSVSGASSCLPSTPDVFDFPDDRSGGSGSSYPSPSPHTNPFSFVGSPNARGGGTKRRPRRKAANVGDRTASTDSNAPEPIKKPRMSNKPSMMASLKGRGRGNRKSSGLPMPEMERPMLQRSYSDYTATQSHSFPPPSTHVESPVQEEDSDDEACDPPPPPKNLASLIAAAAAAPPPAPPAPHSTQTALSSLLATTTAAATAGDPDKIRVQPSRKTSFELLLGHKKSSTTTLPPPPLLKKPISLVSDIYDDGLDSPPLPGSSLPTLTPVQGPSFPLPGPMAAALNQTTVKIEPPAPAINSPKVEPPSEPPATKAEKIDPNKLILKLPKQRSSPSVDHQKNKISIIPPEKVKTEKEKEKGERRKKESKARDDKKERTERAREDNRNKKRKADTKNDRDHKRHKAGDIGRRTSTTDGPPPPPKIDSLSSLPFLQQQTLHKNFKIPRREDKDTAKDPITPTTPFTPSLTSPSMSNSFSSMGSSGHTLPPMNKPIIKKHPIPSSAQIRLNLPPIQPATYLPKKSQSDSSRRSSGGSSSSYLPSHVSSIPLPKGPVPERSSYSDRSSSSFSRWNRASQQPPPAHSQPPPRSPSPDAAQIDDANSPEDSLRIAEE